MPSIIIGLTIVAMGTSLPECAVSVTASMAGNNALAVSNVVGSNIFNLMVVCGACALFSPLMIQRESLFQKFPFSIFCGLLLLGLGAVGMVVGSLAGVLLLVIFAGYILSMVRSALKAREAWAVSVAGEVGGSNIFNILFVLGIAATLSPVAFIGENIIDLLLLTAMSVLVWVMGWTDHQVSRKEGAVMLSIYAAYLVYICVR